MQSTSPDQSKFVCTKDDLTKLNDFLIKFDVIELCSREKINTNWRFHKLTNLTMFAALVKVIPMGCKEAALPKPLLKNRAVNCIIIGENTKQPLIDILCLSSVFALHLHGNHKLEEEISEFFRFFNKKKF